jgi:hypothetical protein
MAKKYTEIECLCQLNFEDGIVICAIAALCPTQAPSCEQTRMSNVEQGLPAFGGARGDQGISNDEV